MKKLLPLFAALALTACAGAETVIDRPNNSSTSSVSTNGTTSSVAAAPTSTPQATDNPESIRIDMDFASQAPTGNWDMPYQEACEEASLIIVHHYLEGTTLDAGIMDRAILDIVAFEESKGLPPDIDMLELADVAREKYGYDAEVIEGNDVTIERIESELAKGNPIIAPFAGQDLGNPNFSGDGPPYHVLVILGYDDDQFITHDVGTRNGKNYKYDKDVIMDAIHDWTGSKDAIRSGPKRLLVVTK